MPLIRNPRTNEESELADLTLNQISSIADHEPWEMHCTGAEMREVIAAILSDPDLGFGGAIS